MKRWRRLVYFARRADGTGPIKIGASSCPFYRVKQLGFDHGEKFEVLVEADGDLSAERQLHRDFAYCRAEVSAFRVRRTGRNSPIAGVKEWYHPVPALLRLISELKVGSRVLPTDERNREIAWHYRAGETLQVIGDRFGITRERVRQILRDSGVPSRGHRRWANQHISSDRRAA